jgi:ribosomal protein S18 acetylase RimI-like enzyme
MNEHNLSDEELDLWVEINTAPASRTQRFCAEFERLRSQGYTHIHRHYYSDWDGFAERQAAVEAAGLPVFQAKRTFTWNKPRPAIKVPDRLTFRTLAEIGADAFLKAMEAQLEGTLDRSTQADIADTGGKSIAACVKEEWDEISEYFAYEPEWFQMAYYQDQAVGYTQPVIYPGADKGKLKESTLYNIAVLPGHRGRGYINDILARSVQTLQQLGIWRIICDTDTENIPMIKAFQRAAFTEEGIMYRWRGEIGTLLA